MFFSGILLVGLSAAQSVSLLSAIPDSLEFNHFPVYIGAPQAVHPDVVYFKNPTNGHHFYMSVTPIAYSDKNENPSILVSDNGYDFYEDQPGINPLTGTCAYDHNDDPDLFWNESTHEFYMHYLETMRPDSQNVNLLKSSDGISWTLSTAIHYNLQAGDSFIVSPSMTKKDSLYYLFYVNITASPRKIQYLTSTDGLTWNKNDTHGIAISFPVIPLYGHTDPWHLDVFADENGKFYMLCSAYPGNMAYAYQQLYLATSTDLINWDAIQKPIIECSSFFGSQTMIYRSTGIVDLDNDILVVWASYKGTDEWRIAEKKFSLSGIISGYQAPTALSYNLEISPNPCNGRFAVKIDGQQGSKVVCEICNILGEKVYSAISFNQDPLNIDISSQPGGIYFLQVKINREVVTKKIFVNR